jgi:undecaprenyl diphosphate synthase
MHYPPQHVAIIMDGNGRWAKSRGLPRAAGHRSGVKAVRTVIEECAKHKVRYLTLFTFSSENWRRPPDEVGMLMNLFLDSLEREVEALHGNAVRLRFIGDRSLLGANLAGRMAQAEALTADNTGLGLMLAMAYGGRWDITQACRRLAADAVAGIIDAAKIDESSVTARLALCGIPDPDLLIRTGGDQRISNFLLWNMAYTELYFCDALWPDFSAEDLNSAFEYYGVRERRIGMTSEQIAAGAAARVDA